MQRQKSRAYYQYMLDVCDQRVGYYSTEEVASIVYDLLDDGEEEEALTVCQKGLDQHPADDYVEIVMAKVLARLHRYDESQRLLADNPDKDSPFGISISFALDIHRFGDDEALHHLIDSFAHQRLTPREVIDIIDEQFDHLQHDVTSQHLIHLSQLLIDERKGNEEQLAEALGRVGALLMDCGCHLEAIPVLEKAIDIDAYDIYSWQDLSRCQFEVKRYEDCRQSCEMGLAIDPTNPLFCFVMGYMYCDAQEWTEGARYLEIARQYIEGSLQHEDIHLDNMEQEQHRNITYELLGNAYEALGQTDQAIDCYCRLLQRLPNLIDIHRRLALLYISNERYEEAVKVCDKALTVEPDNTSLLTLRVTLNTQTQRYNEALQDLDHLITLNPRSKNLLLAKAKLSFSLERYAEADVAYRSLLKLRPKDEATRSLLRAYFESIGDSDALIKL